MGATVRRAALEQVDPDARTIRTTEGARVAYDALVVAVGARPWVAMRNRDGTTNAMRLARPCSASASSRATSALRPPDHHVSACDATHRSR
jgi:NADH dehydrogenase FAD-containing subunit